MILYMHECIIGPHRVPTHFQRTASSLSLQNLHRINCKYKSLSINSSTASQHTQLYILALILRTVNMYTMKKLLASLLLAGALPSINASSRLMVSSGTPECSGGMELSFLNVACDGYCTFGGFASLSGYSKFIFCYVRTGEMRLISHSMFSRSSHCYG
jgi:hypothetical protein